MRTSRFHTPITELFGIAHPILCGGLIWLADAKYVAACVKAGAMGFITALAFPEPEDFRRQIQLCRDLLGDKHFGVNLSTSQRGSDYRERISPYIDIAIEEEVRFVETSGGSPAWFIDRLKAAGCIVIHKVPGLKYLPNTMRLPVDAVSLVGGEAGGHPGIVLMSTMVQAALLPEVSKVPCVVGGGIGSGRQLAAVLALGVHGVLLGSRMLVSDEIDAHPTYKDRIVAGDGSDTQVRMRIFNDTHRVLPNQSSEKVGELEAAGVTDFEQYRPHVSGSLTRQAYITGDLRTGMIDYGQAVAFADRRESVEAIIDRIIDDAHIAVERLEGLVVR